MEIKTFKSQGRNHKTRDMYYACRLCNDIALLNGASRDLFVVRLPDIIELQSDRYANQELTRAIYATLYVVDSLDAGYYSAYYTMIGYEGHCLQIRVNNVEKFIQNLEAA